MRRRPGRGGQRLQLTEPAPSPRESFRSFARLYDRFDRVLNPGGFLRTAVVNRCRDLGRRRQVEYRFLPLLQPRAAAPPGGGELTDVLAGLGRKHREVIVLRFYGGHTLAEIASLLSIPEGTVRSRLHRALGLLKETLT